MEKTKIDSKKIILTTFSCFLLNFLLSKLATTLSLPLFLDSIGTVMASILCGAVPGMLVGFFTNVFNSIEDPISLYYAVINILIAVTAYAAAAKGYFIKAKGLWKIALIFALFGGGLGSVLTWMLYGFSFGSGISAPLANYIYVSLGFGKFASQLIADMAIDILDKMITVYAVYFILRLLPDSLLRHCPFGCNFMKNFDRRIVRTENRAWICNEKGKRNISLRAKVISIILVTAVLLGGLSVTIGTLLYRNIMFDRYEATGKSAAQLIKLTLDGENVKKYIRTGEPDGEYYELESKLKMIKNSIPEIKYMYVYDIREDGCHVVFDLDTEDVKGAELGEIVDFDESFKKYLPALFAGEKIEPVAAHGQYGWLLTVYEPLYTKKGEFVAYGAVDIPMEAIGTDCAIFAIRLICLLFGAAMFIIIISLHYIQNKIVDPLDKLAEVSGRFAYDSEEYRQKNVELIHELSISTHDEIENLYTAITKTTDDVCEYIEKMSRQSKEIVEQSTKIKKLQDRMILSFAAMVENRDGTTGDHIKRTAEYVEIVARQLRANDKYKSILTDQYIEELVKSAPLHDIGKIKTPDNILNKPGKLTAEEFEVIKEHTTEGARILKDVYKGISENGEFSIASEMALSHHEKWDGSGYPQGISKDKIPLSARIMAIADVFDALVSKRSYKEAYSFDKALEIIKSSSGTHFDPEVVNAFLEALEEVKKVIAE